MYASQIFLSKFIWPGKSVSFLKVFDFHLQITSHFLAEKIRSASAHLQLKMLLKTLSVFAIWQVSAFDRFLNPYCYPENANSEVRWIYNKINQKWVALSKEATPWDAGINLCKEYGGDSLYTSILDDSENDSIIELLNKYGNAEANFWTSGRASSSKNSWYWAPDRTVSKIDWFNWDVNEPNQDSSKNCLAINADNGKWYAADCYERKHHICMVQCDQSKPPPMPDFPEPPPRPNFIDGQGDFFEWYWEENEQSLLEEYLNNPDPNYSWEFKEKMPWTDKDTTAPSPNFETYHLNVTSHRWLTDDDTSKSLWFHQVAVKDFSFGL